jgi:hypothetical protein
MASAYSGYRLGVDTDVAGIRSQVFEAADGESTRQSLGFGAFFVGDVNGDGRDEIAFTEGRGGTSGHGAAYIFSGAHSGSVVPIESAADMTVQSDSLASPAMQFSGLQGARPAGDVNGDGIADLRLSARYTQRVIDGSWQHSGAVGLLYGRATLPSTIGFSQLDTIYYGDAGDQMGQPAMDRFADFDGDGYADTVINDAYASESIGGEVQHRGRLWIMRGGPSLPHLIDIRSSADATLFADTRVPGMFGYTWNMGDWNGDGRPDLVVGDHYAGDHELHEHAGRVYMFYNGSALHVAPR